MKKPAIFDSSKSLRQRSLVGLSLLFVGGLCLRLFRLANPTFWIDEIGVLQAALQPSWQQAVAVAKGHIMGMPLHYAQTWISGQLGLQNEWLRLPDAIWGSLVILVGYRLARYYVEKPVSLLVVVWMATSPLFIRYSQELRFYAGLCFFFLAAILTGLQALEKSHGYRWLIFVLVGMMGILFHAYTIFAVAFVYAALFQKTAWRSWQNARGLLITTILLVGFLGWSIVQFGSVPAYQTSLFAFEPPLVFLLRGLGLAPIHAPQPGTLIYYAILAFGFGGGLIVSIQNRVGQLILPLLTSLVIILIVVGMNSYRHYFVHSRQIYFLAFWVYLLAAQGCYSFYQWLTRQSGVSRENQSHWVLSGMIAILLLSCIPALSQYYTAERTIVRSGYPTMLQHWHRGDQICVIPDFDVTVFTTYWQGEVAQFLQPCNEQDVSQNPEVKFVIANQDMDFSPSFQIIFHPSRDTFYPKIIWMRNR